MTLESVARTAGVTRPTIYRRWPGKEALVAGVLAATVPPLVAPDTGDPVEDLIGLAVGFAASFTSARYASTAFALHAEARYDEELATQLMDNYLAPRAVTIMTVIGAAQRAGRIRPDVPPETVRELVFGPLIYRWLVAGEPVDRATAEHLVTTALSAFRTESGG